MGNLDHFLNCSNYSKRVSHAGHPFPFLLFAAAQMNPGLCASSSSFLDADVRLARMVRLVGIL